MVEFEIRSKKQSIGTMKDKTVYYIHPKAQQHMTNQALVERIVHETSLSAGDVSNALISLSNVVCDALRQGMSVDLADLGALRLNITSKMMDQPEKLTVNDAVNTIKIQFVPKRPMRNAAKQVEMSIDHTRIVPATTRAKSPKQSSAGTHTMTEQ